MLVEDNPGDARLISEMLIESSDEFELEHVDSLSGAIDRLSESVFDVVLLDLTLPDSAGLSTFSNLQDAVPDIAVIVLTGNTDTRDAAQTVQRGAQDFLIKGSVDGELLSRAIIYAHERKAAERQLRDSELKLVQTNEALRRTVFDFADSVGKIVEARDPYTQGHQERVADVAAKIAFEMGLSDDDASAAILAGLVHDVGKIGVPTEILSRPGCLSPHEMNLVRTHSVCGYEILQDVSFPWPIAEITLQHHERLDGSGYPSGLVDGEIMLLSRIIAVADVVEAMASHRPYRPALGLDAAMRELGEHAAKYDPDVVEACVLLWESGRLGL
jgi:HD-GYP domain-containing protein (c-di-GMP phosphodiesterase class II)